MHTVKLRYQTDARSPSQLQAYAARSLDLLHQIEQTVMALSTETRTLQAFADDARGLLERLMTVDSSVVLDPEGRASDLFSKAAEIAQRVHDDACIRREAALADHRLCDEDGVADAYDAFIDAVADYHNVLEDLRERIETHDALLSPVSGTVHTSAAALVAAALARR